MTAPLAQPGTAHPAPPRTSGWRRALRVFLTAGLLIVTIGTTASASPAAPAVTTVGPYHLKFAGSGKCLDDPNFVTDNGTWLDQWSCVNQSNELWYFDYQPDGVTFKIRGVYSNMCVTDSNVKNVENIATLFPCDDPGEYFQRRYDAATNTPPGVYWWYAPTDNPGLALNVQGGSTANNAHLIMWPQCACTNEYVVIY